MARFPESRHKLVSNVPKRLSETLDDQLLLFLAGHSSGVGIDVIATAFQHLASKRTLQRRLSTLIKAGRVRAAGEARAIRYHLETATGNPSASMPTPTADGLADIYVPISPAGDELRDQVRRARAQRTPVGYRREFLDEYRPNETRYLSQDVLDHLHRIGHTPVEDQRAGTYARSMLKRLLIDLSWASSKLEGNTYSLLETERLLELNEAAQGKAAFETQMILNHRNAIEFLVQSATDEDIGVNGYTIRNIHALLADNLLRDPSAVGRLRTSVVGIGGSVYLPLDGGAVLSEAFDQLIATAAAIREPYEQSFFLMAHLPYLQPFEDVNKRVSRLAANIPFIKHNKCPLSFIEVPERPYVDGLLAVYELNRIELLRDVFVWAYERSARRYLAVRQSIGEPDPFRLRYRDAMIAVIGHIIRTNQQPTPEQIRIAAAGQGVAAEHSDHFVRLVQQELRSMHEGNFARYRLRPSEFFHWREQQSAG
jgi:hypothetical protein